MFDEVISVITKMESKHKKEEDPRLTKEDLNILYKIMHSLKTPSEIEAVMVYAYAYEGSHNYFMLKHMISEIVEEAGMERLVELNAKSTLLKLKNYYGHNDDKIRNRYNKYIKQCDFKQKKISRKDGGFLFLIFFVFGFLILFYFKSKTVKKRPSKMGQSSR